jgi:hypothetical protein
MTITNVKERTYVLLTRVLIGIEIHHKKEAQLSLGEMPG